MKYFDKAKMVTGILVTVLFLVHTVQMALLIGGLVAYRPVFKYAGIALTVVMGIHIALCVLNAFNKEARKQKFYILKWNTGAIMGLILFVHGDDYLKEVSILWFHFDKGAVAAFIELLFLVVSTLHIRINVGAMCDHFEMDEKKKLIIGRIACGIATVIILLPGIAICKYFL